MISVTEPGNKTAANYTESLWAVMTHIFPTQVLAHQKWYMCHYIKWVKETTICGFFARWTQLNKRLEEFPPFTGADQCFTRDEQSEVIFEVIPVAWKAKLIEVNFDPVEHTLEEFIECLSILKLPSRLMQ